MRYFSVSRDLHSIDCYDKRRVVQKNGYPFLFWDNFGNSVPILTILSLLQAPHHTFIV